MVAGGAPGGAGREATAPGKGPTVAAALAEELVRRGVRRIFGIPGGGSSLDIIAEAGKRGIDFVLTRSENAAVIMASASAELTDTIGVALGTKGPGVANAMNGLACASLERTPVLFLADGFDPKQAYMTHQVFDQAALAAPVTKARIVLRQGDDLATVGAMLDTALSWPRGPVYLELTGAVAGSPAVGMPHGADAHSANARADAPDGDLNRARELLAQARRPVIIAGLQAVQADSAPGLRRLADALDAPVLPTYKAKGVLPDADPRVVGLYVGGAGEEAAIKAGDLIILYGADPVEFALQPWRYAAPVLEIARHRFERHYVTPSAGLYGDPAALVTALLAEGRNVRSEWDKADLARHRADLRDRLAVRGGAPISPQHVIDAVVAAAPKGTRITVDAGAHMLPVMAFWQAEAPRDVLISNGLATMAYALPAGIAAALAEPDRPVIAFTGDGGLAMCLGELATAAEQRCRLVVVVLNDSALSMIDVKQSSRGLERAGVAFAAVDFAMTAKGLGLRAARVERSEAIGPAIRDACAAGGPALVDIVVDPSGYLEQVKALRG